MDIINQITALPTFSSMTHSNILLAFLLTISVLTIIVSLSAYIVHTPKAGLIRPFLSIIISLMFSSIISIILLNIRLTPSGEVLAIIIMLSSVVTYTALLNATLLRSLIMAAIVMVITFLTYKCFIFILQSQYPDKYEDYNEAIRIVINYYQSFKL